MQTIAASIIILIFVAIVILGILLLIRNHRVYRLRMRIIDMVYGGGVSSDWQEKRRIYRSVTYHQMLFTLNKPVEIESFYTGAEINTLMEGCDSSILIT